MLRHSYALLLLAVPCPAWAAGDAPPPADIIVTAPCGWQMRVSERELDEMRGGFQLPNGLALSVGIDIQSRVDGILVLHTIYASDGPLAGTRLYNDGSAPTPEVPSEASATTQGTMRGPEISFSRSGNGVLIAPGSTAGSTTVNIVRNPGDVWVAAGGQEELPVVRGGPAVGNDLGTYRLSDDGTGQVATFIGNGVTIRHLIGQATGVAVANTANDRSIDTISSVNVDLQGAQPLAFANHFLADALAAEMRIGR